MTTLTINPSLVSDAIKKLPNTSRLSIGLLSNILLEDTVDGLKLTTLTGNSGATVMLPLGSASGQRFCISERHLSLLVAVSGDKETVDIKVQDEVLKIGRTKVATVDALEYPELPDFQDGNLYLTRNVLAAIVEASNYAKDDFSVLSGVQVKINAETGDVAIRSTDGTRVYDCTQNIETSDIEKDLSFVLGTETCSLLKNFTEGADLFVSTTENGDVQFIGLRDDDQGYFYYTSVVQGNFPNIDRLIPDASTDPSPQLITSKEINDVIATVALLSNEIQALAIKQDEDGNTVIGNECSIGEVWVNLPTIEIEPSLVLGLSINRLKDMPKRGQWELVIRAHNQLVTFKAGSVTYHVMPVLLTR